MEIVHMYTKRMSTYTKEVYMYMRQCVHVGGGQFYSTRDVHVNKESICIHEKSIRTCTQA